MVASSSDAIYPDAITALLQQTMGLALNCHRAQQWDEAARLYAAVLRLQPQHPDANHNFGTIMVEKGDYLGAIPYFQAALQAQSNNFQYWFSLINALILGDEHSLAADVLEDARRAGMPGNNVGDLVQRLVDLAINKATHHTGKKVKEPPAKLQNQLGNLYEQEKFAEAIALGEQLAQDFPSSNKAPKALIAAWMRLEQNHKIEPYLQQILCNNPSDVDALNNYGSLKAIYCEMVQAEIFLRQALYFEPKLVSAWMHLGIILNGQRRFFDAEMAYVKALDLDGCDPKTLINYGALLTELNRFPDAKKVIEKLIEQQPNSASAYISLGILLQNQGFISESLAALKYATDLDPKSIGAFHAYLFTVNCNPEMDAKERFLAYQEFNRRFGEPLHQQWKPHSNSKNTARRLRVGYVAPVFRSHSTRLFLEPLLAHHNPERVELFAYAQFEDLPDLTTDRYRSYFEHWYDITKASDEQLVQQIRADGIDILVDIAGVTRGNRLTTFAHKPAPVSLHWLDSGYTTGLTAIDYYLTDAATVPAGTENLFSEKIWRLPHTGLVFRPNSGMGEVNTLPALGNRHITFGTLTRAIRLNQKLISVWAKLLQRVPDSILVINSQNFRHQETRELWLKRFEDLGIDRNRLDIGCESPPWNVLRSIDIALDCFPQNSGTTLFESLYMGLPFVSLSGTPSMGTLGASILTALGRPEWIAYSEEEYLDKLVALASDIPALATMRAGLRQAMQASPLMDEPAFARDVEDAYFAMFQHWADTHPETTES